MALAHLALTLALLAPQDKVQGDPRFTSALSSSEQKKLNKLAKDWFEAWQTLENTEPGSRQAEHAQRGLSAAKEKFDREWSGKQKKEPMKHMGDLLAIFDKVFPYERQPSSGQLKTISAKDMDSFSVRAPKRYDEDESYACVIVIPDRVEAQWTDAGAHFEKTWESVVAAEDFLFVVPHLGNRKAGDIELDPMPDFSADTGNVREVQNIAAVLQPAGEAQRLYRVDRNRLVLDCGKGSSAYGLRLATYFPGRFAGLILRHPVDTGKLRLDSLTGTPVLLLESDETKQACEVLESKLNELQEGSCQRIAAGDDAGAKIAEWAAGLRRDLFRPRVVLAPNHQVYHGGYWVQAQLAVSMRSDLAPEDLPRVVAQADREANRITVDTKNVSAVVLYLNDALIDLDKEFTIVLNGKAVTEKRARSFYDMTEWLFDHYDPNFIWTSHYSTAITREDAEDGAKEATSGGTGEGNGK